MQCLSPINIPNPNFGKRPNEMQRLIVPCGRCMACLSRKRDEWSIRMEEELKVASSAFFVTLTYDDEHLTFNDAGFPVVSKRDIQLFMKRLRKSCPDHKIVYYLTSEYGPRTFRPHYHAIFFNLPNDIGTIDQVLIKAWQKGFVSVGSVTPASIRYCAKYCISKSDVPDFLDPVFMLCSKGIGLNYVDTLKSWHEADNSRFYVPRQNFKVALPRYYKEKLYSESDRKKYAEFCQELSNSQDLVDPYRDNQCREYYVNKVRKQVDKSSKL